MSLTSIMRAGQRNYDQLRSLKVTYNIFPYAPSSALFELGNTKVLCAITVQPGVPNFLKNSNTGWLTAEYNMLPAATHTRSQRESVSLKRNGRNIEISRFLGRALRSIINLEQLGEYTITVDCDVLQADGGTRVAALCGAYLALRSNNNLRKLLLDEIAAVSLGIQNQQILLDLDYQEDSTIDSDFTFVLTRSGKIVELHAIAENNFFDWDQYQLLHKLALKGSEELFAFYDTVKIVNN